MSWFKRAFGKKGRERATTLVTQGYVHAREGRLDEARKVYEAAVDADEGFAVAHLNLGLCRLDLLNRDAAALDEEARFDALDAIAASLDRALALDGAQWMGWRALARVQERRAKWAKAEDAWTRFIETAPHDGSGGAGLAVEVAEAKKARDAIKARAHADRVRRRALAALSSDTAEHERSEALAALTPLLDVDDANVAAVLPRGAALAGTLARRAGDRAQARALLERAAHEDRADVDALKELASVCMEDGDLQRALTASIDAYRERPSDAGLVCNVGVCHLGLGDVDKAAEYIDIAWRLEPKDPIVLRAREALAQAQAQADGQARRTK